MYLSVDYMQTYDKTFKKVKYEGCQDANINKIMPKFNASLFNRRLP